MGVRHILLTVHYRSTTVGGSEGFHVKLFIYDFTHKTGPLLQVRLRAETRDKGRNTLSDHAPDTPHTLGCSLPKTHAVILPHHWNQHSLPHAHARVFNPSLFSVIPHKLRELPLWHQSVNPGPLPRPIQTCSVHRHAQTER